MTTSQVHDISRKHATLALALAVGVLTLTSPGAFAGGLAAASGAATSFNIWAVSIVAILATSYLLYEGVKAWTGHGDWINGFGVACIKVAVTGSVVVLVPYLWNLFTFG